MAAITGTNFHFLGINYEKPSMKAPISSKGKVGLSFCVCLHLSPNLWELWKIMTFWALAHDCQDKTTKKRESYPPILLNIEGLCFLWYLPVFGSKLGIGLKISLLCSCLSGFRDFFVTVFVRKFKACGQSKNPRVKSKEAAASFTSNLSSHWD